MASITELINELPSEINHLQRDIFNPVWQILKKQGHDESSNWKCLPLKRTGLKTQELGPSYVYAVPSCHNVNDGIENESFFMTELDLIIFVTHELERVGASLETDKVEMINSLKEEGRVRRRKSIYNVSKEVRKARRSQRISKASNPVSLATENSTQSLHTTKSQSHRMKDALSTKSSLRSRKRILTSDDEEESVHDIDGRKSKIQRNDSRNNKFNEQNDSKDEDCTSKINEELDEYDTDDNLEPGHILTRSSMQSCATLIDEFEKDSPLRKHLFAPMWEILAKQGSKSAHRWGFINVRYISLIL